MTVVSAECLSAVLLVAVEVGHITETLACQGMTGSISMGLCSTASECRCGYLKSWECRHIQVAVPCRGVYVPREGHVQRSTCALPAGSPVAAGSRRRAASAQSAGTATATCSHSGRGRRSRRGPEPAWALLPLQGKRTRHNLEANMHVRQKQGQG
jgi:hypothetical protein